MENEVIGNLIDELNELGLLIEAAKSKASEIARDARRSGIPEVARVVGGQLNIYTTGTLEAFESDNHQPGSVASLIKFLEDEFED